MGVGVMGVSAMDIGVMGIEMGIENCKISW